MSSLDLKRISPGLSIDEIQRRAHERNFLEILVWTPAKPARRTEAGARESQAERFVCYLKLDLADLQNN